MAGVGDGCASGKFIVTDDGGYSFSVGVVSNSEWPSHLLPEIINLDLFQSSLHEFMNLGKDILLPIIQKFIQLYLRWLGLQQILTLNIGMSLQALLFDFITRS